MTLIKKDLVSGVIEKVRFKPRKKRKGQQQFLFPELDYTPLSRKRATDLVNTTLEIVKRALERGEDVRIHGFGTFQSRFKWARRGRHPRTGEPIVLNSRRSITFRAFSRLRRRVNGTDPSAHPTRRT